MSQSFLSKQPEQTDGCFSHVCYTLFADIIFFLFPSHHLKTVNKQLATFFEDEDITDICSSSVSIEGFVREFDENSLRKELMNTKFDFGEKSQFNGKTFNEIFKEKGFNEIKIVFDTEDFFVHRLEVYNHKVDVHHLLIQLFIRCEHSLSVHSCRDFSNSIFKNALQEGAEVTKNYFKNPTISVTTVEWLRIQDYTSYDKEKMLLPSQLHNGLGLTREVHRTVQHYATQYNRDGVSNTPEQWHNALQYLKLDPPFKFLNPAFEGIFLSINEAVKEDIQTKGYSQVVWAISSRCLKRRDSGEKFDWLKMEQISPISKEMNGYFDSDKYKEIVKKNFRPDNLYIDWNMFHPM
ncbi:hypothetical protein EIN_411310 [Entamoeba invadens IP1]|uniref:Uncharacterized protein n=1 Tax=Entamoeba invadens IP1 TaxID=370355 RepID=A0A0A1U172_ENTIV|nr:hypothetical protein EIN_411310 [Entamoeba invadens IP1]ELP87778.1 hypothetical protein EIN_411310 [Entamoeba invadens IP1]|eukprot:XP_004254549.1 hypothetical protein EIN_411310 [Entamoeba invadens IP1]